MKISGKVIQGRRKGKELGFPTVNIKLENKIESGVYEGGANFDGKKYKAGIFINNEGTLLEAHIVRFSGDLYGKDLEIEIGKKIRNTIKFETEEELKKQIIKDIELICLQE